MEEIITRLLVSDNTVIQQATKDIKTALKSPSAIADLCTVVITSKDSKIRQYAAVLLRQRLSKAKNWNNLDAQFKARFIQEILGALQTENEQPVIKAIAQLIGTIAKHELSTNNTSDVLEFVKKLCRTHSSGDHSHKGRGYFILCVLSDECPDVFASELPSTGALVVNVLQNEYDFKSPMIWHCLTILKNVAAQFRNDQSIKNSYSIILPKMLGAFNTLSESGEIMACDLLEMLDDIVTNNTITVLPQILMILDTCMELSITENMDDQIKIKALTVIDTIVKLKKRAVLKYNLVKPIINALMRVMQLPSEELDYESTSEFTCPVIHASQVLDALTLNLPPSKIMPYILECSTALADSKNPEERKAAFLMMAVSAEGCAEYIIHNCMNNYLELLCDGLRDPIPLVGNAALYALGQFSEHLQPEFGKNAERLMPVLFKFLEYVTANLKKLEGKIHLDRVFYALETFTEHSEKDKFIPFLPVLISSLVSLVKVEEGSTHLKQLALSAIGACASSSEEKIAPYFPQIVECLSVYLVKEFPPELTCLQVQAIETMATLARSVPPEKFQQVAQDCIRYGFMILEDECDPEVEGSIYGLFGAISAVLKENMNEVMNPIITKMMKTIESSEGIIIHFDEDETTGFPSCGDLSDSPDEVDLEAISEDDDDSEDVTDYSVENVYVDKKVGACYAIKELAANTGAAFFPYLQPCFPSILKLLEYPNEAVKKAALDVLTQIFISWSVSVAAGEESSTFDNNVSVFIQKCAEIVHTCDDRDTVAQALDAYAKFLKSAKNFCLKQISHREAIFNCVLDVFHRKTLCQLEEEEDDEELSSPAGEETAEKEELLIEFAGDIVPYFGRSMSVDTFKPYFTTFFPLLQNMLKRAVAVSQRSFCIGIMAECMEPLGPILDEFSNDIFPEFIAGARHENCDVRNNAVYGIGELLLHGKDLFYAHYDDVLQLLSQCLGRETVPKVVDNICGAVARMIVANANLVPIPQVFPVILTCLPLKKDFKENTIIMKCFLTLYECGHDIIALFLDKVLHTVIYIIHHNQGEEDALLLAKQLFFCVQRDFPDILSRQRIPAELKPTYSMLLNKKFR